METGNQFHVEYNDVIGLVVDIETVLSSAIAKVDVAKWLFRLSRVNAHAWMSAVYSVCWRLEPTATASLGGISFVSE